MVRRTQQRRSSLAAIGLIGGGIGLVMAVIVITSGTGRGQEPAQAMVAVGESAPEIRGVSSSGETVRLSELRGRPVAVNFWATWCPPCRAEMPEFMAAEQRYAAEGLIVLAVNAGENADTVLSFKQAEQITLLDVLDPNGVIVDSYLVDAFPTTFWVDAEGIVQARHIGMLDTELIDAYMADLLESSAGGG